jgi:tetratricopeptide (TPR) repeat protein
LAKTREASPLAIHSARQALALNPNLAEAHEVLGISRVLLDYDWAEAEASFRTALACADASSRTRHRFAFHVLLPTGRLEEALAMGRRALDEDPLALLNYVSLAFTLLSMRRYTECIAECRKALNINPSYWPLRAVQAMVNLELGQAAQAVENLEAARTTMPSSDWLHAIHALALRRMGREEEGAKVLSAAAIREPSALAVYHIDDEDLTRFFDYCEEAVEGRDPNLARLAVEPFYDRIRVHPRYSELLRQLNLTRLLPHG